MPGWTSLSAPDCVVVGAGVGGLASAVRLAAAGRRVLVVEASPFVGGKMRSETVAGRSIDVGPTVLTMRGVFDDLFAAAGTRLDEHLTLQPLDVLARHAWPDGSRLDLLADEDASAAAIAQLAGPQEAAGYRRFVAYARRIHDTVEQPFMRTEPTSLMKLLRRSSWRQRRDLARIDWHRSMWRALADFFTDPRLRQLFARYATYYGSSPFAAPATLNLIAHVEARGVWTVAGGMRRLAAALADVLRSLGGEIVLDSPVDEIELDDRGRTSGVRLVGGYRIAADTVVFNGAPQALAAGRLGPRVRRAVRLPRRAAPSLSAVTFAAVGRAEGVDLHRHNVAFSDDYPREFRRVFEQGRVPDRPTVYICAQDRGEDEPPPSWERFLILVNAPPRGDDDDFEVDLQSCQHDTMEQLRRCGISLQMRDRIITTPRQFAARYPATGGALYGTVTHGAMSAFGRPGPRSAIEGLYLAGGGVHPGAGVPMVATSGQLAAEAILADQPSTPRFRPVGTCGGTSTRSPMTAARP